MINSYTLKLEIGQKKKQKSFLNKVKVVVVAIFPKSYLKQLQPKELDLK